jgi:hypothetical protein
MPDNIDDKPMPEATPVSVEPHSLVAPYINHANSIPEGDRIAVAVQVISSLLDNAREGGTFRYLIYDRLGFSPDAYVPLYSAGGMLVADNFILTDHLEQAPPPIVNALEAIAKAEPMEPHPTLTRADGSAVPWPTQKRSDLFAALHFMHDILASNRALVETNRRLAAQCDKLEQDSVSAAKLAAESKND